jgi:hypothetical protein
MRLPRQVNVMGKIYRVEYTTGMVETDIDQRSAIWGQVDYHTRSIRVYRGTADKPRQAGDVIETLLHEIIHAILQENKLLKDCLKDGVDENFTDTLGVVLADTLVRNKLITVEGL